jgi:hypothetical protein
MRLVAAALVVLAVSGCVKVRVASQDFTNNTFVICGNKNAGSDDLDKKAREVCPAGPSTLRCGDKAYGSVSFDGGVTKDLYGLCCDYKCPR